MDSLGTRVGEWARGLVEDIGRYVGVWINTVTVTETWGISGGGGSRREKGREKKGSGEVGTGGWRKERNSPYISPVINLVRGVKKKRTYLGLLCCSLLYANTSPIAW